MRNGVKVTPRGAMKAALLQAIKDDPDGEVHKIAATAGKICGKKISIASVYNARTYLRNHGTKVGPTVELTLLHDARRFIARAGNVDTAISILRAMQP